MISELDTIKEALVRLDYTAKKILFVTDAEKKLLGTVTDGDIRRWILRNGDLNSNIEEVMNRNPVYLEEVNEDEALSIMLEKTIDSVPILDERKNIIKIIFLNEQLDEEIIKKSNINSPVVIMAGGLGTRLHPYTKILPKPLIPIGDTPIIERIVNKFNSYGCKDFYLTVNYKKNMIKSYFNELEKNYAINYIEEDKPLGTGGSLSLLKGKINETFFVSNCDILIDTHYDEILKYHKEKGNKVTIISSLKNFVIPYGVFRLDKEGEINKIEEKPEYSYLINTGMYVLEPEVINDIPDNTFFNLPDILEIYMKKNVKIGVYPISEKAWMDMGQINEMQDMIDRIESNNRGK
nr:nucleotidyltransferase family protein [Clostridium cavendishii]